MNDEITTIQQLRNKIEQFVKARNWQSAHNPKNLAMSIAIEAAEIMEIFQWLSHEDALNIKENEAEFLHLQEEISDVIIYCLSLANRLDIDVAAAIEAKINKNETRFPIN